MHLLQTLEGPFDSLAYLEANYNQGLFPSAFNLNIYVLFLCSRVIYCSNPLGVVRCSLSVQLNCFCLKSNQGSEFLVHLPLPLAINTRHFSCWIIIWWSWMSMHTNKSVLPRAESRVAINEGMAVVMWQRGEQLLTNFCHANDWLCKVRGMIPSFDV